MDADFIRERVERERKAQGLPPRITDPVTITRVAAIIRGASANDPVPVVAASTTCTTGAGLT